MKIKTQGVFIPILAEGKYHLWNKVPKISLAEGEYHLMLSIKHHCKFSEFASWARKGFDGDFEV